MEENGSAWWKARSLNSCAQPSTKQSVSRSCARCSTASTRTSRASAPWAFRQTVICSAESPMPLRGYLADGNERVPVKLLEQLLLKAADRRQTALSLLRERSIRSVRTVHRRLPAAPAQAGTSPSPTTAQGCQKNASLTELSPIADHLSRSTTGSATTTSSSSIRPAATCWAWRSTSSTARRSPTT